MNATKHVPEPLLLPMYISLRNPWDYPNKRFPGSKRNPGNAHGNDRNRRVSSPLSPIFSLFLAPTGILYQKVQHLVLAPWEIRSQTREDTVMEETFSPPA